MINVVEFTILASLCVVIISGLHMDNQSWLTFYMPMNFQDVSRYANNYYNLAIRVMELIVEMWF